MVACAHGAYDIAQRLVSMGANVNAKDKSGFTPLTFAASAGYTHIYRLLLDVKADAVAVDNTALHHATVMNFNPPLCVYVGEHGHGACNTHMSGLSPTALRLQALPSQLSVNLCYLSLRWQRTHCQASPRKP